MAGRNLERFFNKLPYAWKANHSVTVGTGTAVTMLITVPSAGTAYDYLEAEISASNSGTFEFSEAPNTSGGTTVTPVHMNRDIGGAANITVAHTATYTSSGTVLESHEISDHFPCKTGSTINNVWKLDPEVLYLLRFTADNASTEVHMNITIYEET